jgi:hypothetical protein
MRAYLSLWEEPATAGPLFTIVRSALASPRAAEHLRAIFGAQAVRPFTAALSGQHPETRAALAGAHLLGIVIARYVVRIESLATMNREELITACAPAIQRYLTAGLPIEPTLIV